MFLIEKRPIMVGCFCNTPGKAFVAKIILGYHKWSKNKLIRSPVDTMPSLDHKCALRKCIAYSKVNILNATTY